MSSGSAPAGSIVGETWKQKPAGDHYQKIHGDECYFQMFQSLIDNKTITDMKVFFESGVNPGYANFVKGAKNFVIPEINLVKEYIDDDTIIFVRGGFRHWHDFLLQYKGKNWLICYAANTGRDKWTWWDIVFDDLGMTNEIDRHGRYHFPFVKPTNENIFHPQNNPIIFDICIGASNIHDKKGQWQTVKVIETFKNKYGFYPKTVMPGGTRRSTQTLEMLKTNFVKNEVVMPGILKKSTLSYLFSECKIFMHLGTGGQNDRSILEAHACGIPVVLSNTPRFTPLLVHDYISTFVFNPGQSYEQWADHLFDILRRFDLKEKKARAKIYQRRMGYDSVVIPQLTKFFKMLKGNPPNIESKVKLMDSFKSYGKRRYHEK